MQRQAVCPSCKTENSLIGIPYNLPIGSIDIDMAYTCHKIILILCDECGAILGSHRTDRTDIYKS